MFSCKTDNKENSIKNEITLNEKQKKEEDTKFKYVIAESGLNYRKNPNGEIIGNLNMVKK